MALKLTRSVAVIGTRGFPSYYGGFETAVRKVAPRLADHGWAVTVFGRPGATVQEEAEGDSRVVSRTTAGWDSKSLSTLTYGFTAVVACLRLRPDVVLAMNVANGYWLPLLRIARIPVVVNVDGIEWERAKWGRLAKLLFLGGAKMTVRWATRLICDAQEISRYWQDRFGRESDFIPYGGTKEVDSQVEEGLTSGGYVLYVARFVPENSIDAFLRAAEVLAERWDVVIVGSGGYGTAMDDRVREVASGNIRWLGHIQDDDRLNSLWEHAGVYFHGHSVGGTNPALVQAMACGAPTVARDTVYNREVLGDGGVFVEPAPEAIAEAITRLMDDQAMRESKSTAARVRAAENYTWEAVSDKYEASLLATMADAPWARRQGNGNKSDGSFKRQ